MIDDEHPLEYDKKVQKAKELLENQYEFPCEYMFKFIVPKDQETEIRSMFPDSDVKIRPSKNGNYLSLTVSIEVSSSDLVLAIYEKASKIKGLIAL